MWSAERRWERLAKVMLWMGVVFVAASAYGVYSGDDWRGVTMTIAPGALCLAVWQLVSLRLDGLVRGDRRGRIRRIASVILVCFGALALSFVIAADEERQRPTQTETESIYIPDLVICDLPVGPNGRVIPSLANKRDCPPRDEHTVSR